MSNFLIYLMKVSLITVVLYSFYWLFLRKNNFHQLNRVVLMFIIPFSIICPLISFTSEADYIYRSLDLKSYSEILYSNEQTITRTLSKNYFSITSLLSFLYTVFCIVFLIRFIRNISSIFRLKKSADNYNRNDFTFVISDKINAPFSFFYWIFLPKVYSETAIYHSIIEHEKVHSRQLHSLDLILTEAFCIAFWFNPFVFLLKKSLKVTHEYIADNEVISNGITTEEYLKLLISSVEMSYLSGITNQFKSLTIKKRVEMITKDKSSKYAKYLYLLIIPVIAFSILAFSGKYSRISAQTETINRSQNLPSIKPIKEAELEKISSGWGMRKHPITGEMKMHEGVDIVAKEGTSVYATANGKVTQVEFQEEGKGYGRVVVIQHGTEYSSVYAQLSAFNVKVGDEVKKGDVIGYVGHSGLATGPHLHYEVIKSGKRVDPALYW